MKQVSQSELQVGRLYCDQPSLNSFHAVIMQYLGRIKGNHEFKYIYGFNEYINEGDGIIRLAHYKKEPNWYWRVPKEKEDIILKGCVKAMRDGQITNK